MGGSRGGAVPRPPLPRDTGYLLHAWRLEFPHPSTGDTVMLVAPPPAPLCDAGEEALEEAAARALEADLIYRGEDGEVAAWRRASAGGGGGRTPGTVPPREAM